VTESLRIIVPSRGRPGNAERLVRTIQETRCTKEVSSLLVIVDADDTFLPGYMQASEGWPEWATLRVNHKLKNLNPILNAYAVEEAQNHSHIAFLGDDHVPRTEGWDHWLIKILNGKPGVSYGNDLFQGPNLPTAVVMSADLIRVLGYMSPPPLHHLYMDNFWKMLGEFVDNLQYIPDVVIEHIHPMAGKAEWTPEYQRTCGQQLLTDDRTRFEYFLATRWKDDTKRLREHFNA
jgi:hypothetical protein